MKLQITKFLIVIFGVFSSGCNDTSQISDLENMSLSANIKEFIEFELSCEKEKKEDTISKKIFVFNSKGFLTKRIDSFYISSNYHLIIYKYNFRNQLIEELYFDIADKLFNKVVYKYINDTIVDVTSFDERDRKYGKISCYSNSKGLLKQEKGEYYFEGDSIYYEANYEYKNNTLISKDMTNSDSILNNKLIKFYGNINNQPEKVQFFDKFGNLESTFYYKYKFDIYNNWTEKIEYNDSVLVTKYFREYVY